MDATERRGNDMNPFAMSWIANASFFAWIINGSQIILATAVLTLLLIWWVEVRNGRVW